MTEQVVGEQDSLSGFLRIRVVHDLVTGRIPMDTHRAREQIGAGADLAGVEVRIGEARAATKCGCHELDANFTGHVRMVADSILDNTEGRENCLVVLTSPEGRHDLGCKLLVEPRRSEQPERPRISDMSGQVRGGAAP